VSAVATVNDLRKNKPIRQAGQDPATLPTYTIPEAAILLAVPRRTLQDWYRGQNPILKPSGSVGGIPLLSFLDLKEAYKVHVLRTKEHFSLQYLRRAMTQARQEFGSDHPLLDKDIVVLDRLVMNIPGRGRRPRKSIGLGSPHRPDYFPLVVRAWAKRIVSDHEGHRILPWRFLSTKNEERRTPVSIDPQVMSGRLVVTGTRIPVEILRRRSEAGEMPRELAKDYRISVDLVRNALRHIGAETTKKAA
jgi:uncharacterized protein (DUF433 family)